jgi:hypothetical protein
MLENILYFAGMLILILAVYQLGQIRGRRFAREQWEEGEKERAEAKEQSPFFDDLEQDRFICGFDRFERMVSGISRSDKTVR